MGIKITRIRSAIAVLALIISLAAISDMALGEVLITEALYDPATSDSDSEFVELYNTGDSAVDISGWSINTTSRQAVMPENTLIGPGSYYLIADIDGSMAWPADWPEPDLPDEISLTNTDSGIKLLDQSNNLVDALGWGNPPETLYLGTPASHVPEGESLARKQQSSAFVQTRNNSNDFLAALPTPMGSRAETSPEADEEIIIHASVEGNAPVIISFSLSHDDSANEGIQILPLAGKTQNLTISAIISDLDGIEDIEYVRLYGKGAYIELAETVPANSTTSEYSAVLPMMFYDSPGLYNLTLEAADLSGLAATKNQSIEYLSIVAFGLDTSEVSFRGSSGQSSDIIGDLDFSTSGSPTIKNIGNTPLDFRLSASGLDSGISAIPASSLLYTFLDSDFSSSLSGSLSEAAVLEEVGLMPGQSSLRELSLRLMIPIGTRAGSYQGTLYLSGVSS